MRGLIKVATIAIVLALGVSASAQSAPAVAVRLGLDAAGYRAEFSLTSDAPIVPANVNPGQVGLFMTDTANRIVLTMSHFLAGPALPVGANENGRTPHVALTFTADALPPRPGMYTLHAALKPGAFVRDGVDLRADSTATANVYVAARPLHRAELKPGQRFLAAAADREGDATVDPPLFDERGVLLRREQIGLRVVTLTAIDTSVSPHALRFAVDGIGTAKMRSDADVAHVPGLVPILDDGGATALEHAYAGRPVWTIGSQSVHCVTAGNTVAFALVTSDARLTIAHVFRVANVPTHYTQIGREGGDDFASAYTAANPLVVIMTSPIDEASIYGGGYSNPDVHSIDLRRFDFAARCVAFAIRFADVWDFSRAFASMSMAGAHPEWTAATLQAIAARQVRVGMSHEMIARMFGYPPVYGTAEELDRLAVWDFTESAPSARTVYFRGNAVQRYDPPGQMP